MSLIQVLSKSLEKKATTLATECAALDKVHYSEKRILEAGVIGSLRNPSQSDQEAGRICYSDMIEQRGEVIARQWDALRGVSFYEFYNKLRSREAKALFSEIYWKLV